MEKVKISETELNELKESQQKINQNIYELGQIEIQLFNLEETRKVTETNKQEILNLLRTLAQNEANLVKALEKYGKGSLDMNTGEISLNQ